MDRLVELKNLLEGKSSVQNFWKPCKVSEIEKIMEEQVEENPHPAGNGELKTRLVEFENLLEGGRVRTHQEEEGWVNGRRMKKG